MRRAGIAAQLDGTGAIVKFDPSRKAEFNSDPDFNTDIVQMIEDAAPKPGPRGPYEKWMVV